VSLLDEMLAKQIGPMKWLLKAFCPVCIGKGEIPVHVAIRTESDHWMRIEVKPMECFACEGSGLRRA
jgi:hypothetical protein